MKDESKIESSRPLSLPSFCIIDMKVLQDRRLTDFDVVLYSLISGLANNEKNCCYSGNDYLTEFLDVSEKTIQRSLKRLQQFGYIEVKIFKGNKRSIKTYINIALELREKKLQAIQERTRELKLLDYDWLNEKGGNYYDENCRY